MKTKNIFTITLMVIAACVVAVVSCTKEKTEKTAKGNDLLVIDADNMDDYLIAFKQKLLSAEKGEETIGLEQARLDLGNLLNFDFGDANYATDMFQHDTLYVKLSCDNGVVDLSRLAVTYNDALSKITASFKAVDLPEKSVYAIFCEYDEAGSRDGNTEDVRIVVTYRGLGNNVPGVLDTLDWKPRRFSGTCDGSIIHWGAPETMEQWITAHYPMVGCPNGGRLYFTDEDMWFKDGYETYDPIAGRYKIFTMFTYRIDTVCIPHEDMLYYFQNIINCWEQEKPSTHVVIEPWINSPVIPYSQPNVNHYPGDCYYWRVRITHGKPNCTDTNPLI